MLSVAKFIQRRWQTKEWNGYGELLECYWQRQVACSSKNPTETPRWPHWPCTIQKDTKPVLRARWLALDSTVRRGKWKLAGRTSFVCSWDTRVDWGWCCVNTCTLKRVICRGLNNSFCNEDWAGPWKEKANTFVTLRLLSYENKLCFFRDSVIKLVLTVAR